jgi:hypothetical protein
MIKTYTVLLPKFRRRIKLQLLNIALIVVLIILFICYKNSLLFIVIFPLLLWSDKLFYSREDPFEFFDRTIIFDKNIIVIGDEIFHLDKLDKLAIDINNYDGETIAGRGVKVLNGTGNILTFRSNGKTINLLFYINSIQTLDDFSSLFDNWYKLNYKFRESKNGYRTYLLKLRSYKEIEEFKKSYN